MAKKKGDETGANGAGEPEKMKIEGFTAAGAGDNAAWWRIGVDECIVGVLVGVFQMNKLGRDGKKREYAQLRVTRSPFEHKGKQFPAMGVKRDPETDEYGDEPVPLAIGELVNVDLKAKLRYKLKPLVDDGKQYEVIIHAIDKKKDKYDNTPWDFDVLKRPIDDDALPF